MSIDKIQLPAYTHQLIFKNNLLYNKKKPEEIGAENKTKITFSGGNKKKIAFITKHTTDNFVNGQITKFFEGLLAACKLTINDVACLSITENNVASYEEITRQLPVSKLLLFGVSANSLDLPFEIPFFQIQKFREQEYMLSPSLDEIQNIVALKKQLWPCLQKMFDIQQ